MTRSSFFYVPFKIIVFYYISNGNLFRPFLNNHVVTLKRVLTIQQSQLIDVSDVFRIGPTEQLAQPKINNEYLTRVLSERKSNKLKDIVVTIQPKQYQAIASTTIHTMIVQGVAGSGKTEIGLHRIVYLLSPHNGLNFKIAPENVIFLGPSVAFLKYVSNLLPELGVEKVELKTTVEWLSSTLPKRYLPKTNDYLLEKLLSKTNTNFKADINIARFKTSLKIAYLLESYVKKLRFNILKNTIDLMFGNEKLASKDKIKRLIQDNVQKPLNQQRKAVIDGLTIIILRERSMYRKEWIKNQLTKQLEKFWPDYGLGETYSNFLITFMTNNRSKITGLTESELKSIGESYQKKTTRVSQEDFPAICYLNFLLNGAANRKKKKKSPMFDHIVIDESQDVSPLEFLLLQKYSKTQSFTILGDMNQALMPYRGSSSWKEIKQLFVPEKLEHYEIRVSYRATTELTRYANNILRNIGRQNHRAEPYSERHGEKPQLFHAKSYSEMIGNILKDVESLRKECGTIAILTKTTTEAKRILKQLTNAGVSNISLLDKSRGDKENIIVTSIYSAKGMEFDAVILVNARKNNYPKTAFINRLLYIAVTRAANFLHIHGYGILPNILNAPRLISKIN